MTKKVYFKRPSYTHNPTSTLTVIGYGDGGPNSNEKFLDLTNYINKAITDGLISTVATYSQLDLGKLQAIGLSDQVSYTTDSNGLGTITLSDPWSFKSMTLLIDVVTDGDASKNFNLDFVIENGVYNQWTGDSLESFKNFDVWIPQLMVWGAEATAGGLMEFENISLSPAPTIDPDVEIEENKVRFKFLGSTDFGSRTRVVVTII
jgi:hypothetical protein